MFRIETTLFILSSLPLTIALIFSLAVVPRRQTNFQASMRRSNRPATGTPGATGAQTADTEQAVQSGVDRAVETYKSLASWRLLIPATILSVFYWIGLTLGLSFIVDGTISGGLISSWMNRPFAGFDKHLLADPAAAVLGAYLFNTGVLVRRAYVADITKNVMWSSLNRLIFSCGSAIFFHLTLPANAISMNIAILCSFAVAFFPGLVITYLRKETTNALGFNDDTCNELNIQLVQGIDIWKEERLEEEGIESIQNMATAEIFDLIPKLHFPVRTIVDWMDQAIFIQRFATCFQNREGVPSRLKVLEQAGFRISAISAALMGRHAGTPEGDALITLMATTIDIKPAILQASLNQLKDDAQILVLDRLWQTGAAED